MSAALHPLLQHYVKLTEFLGYALGPDYEIALHDLTNKDRSIIAIANNHVSGREIGAPLTSGTLSMLRDKSYESQDYRLHHHSISVGGKALRSCSMFIKQNGQLLGMLCINFDDSRYRAVSQQLLNLCHPDPFVDELLPPLARETDSPAHASAELFRNSTEAVTADAINRELEAFGVAANRLTPEERLQIIAALEKSGIFLMKGAVKEVATTLHCSQASIYRYLTQIRQEAAGESR